MEWNPAFALASFKREKPKWVLVMAARRRKTLVVCRPCHLNAHVQMKLYSLSAVCFPPVESNPRKQQ